MQRTIRNRKFTKALSWLLIMAVILGLFPHMTVPVLSTEKEEAYVLLDDERVSQIILEDDAKLRLEACRDGDVSAWQWQIRDPYSEDRWIDIADGYSKYLWVTHALVGSMLSADHTAYLRCRMETDAGEVCTDPVKVTVSWKVEESAPEQPPEEQPQVMFRTRSAETEYTTYSIVINYLFDDNTIAFEPYGATVAAGSSFKPEPIKSPEIVGYAPFRRVGDAYVDASYVNFDLDSVNENITINVVYEPTLVNYSVHHHLQNVLDDDYSVHYDMITYGQALTGSIVGDGLALSEEELPGFRALAYERLEVAADGSTVIEIRYDRNYYLVDFDMGGGYGTEPVYTRYGATVGANDPIRHGYVFAGWELVAYNGQTPTNEQKSQYALQSGTAIEVPAANLRYKARWITQETTYTMVFWCENANDNGYTYWGYLDNLPAMSGSYVSGQDYISRVTGIEDEKFFTFNESKTDKNKLVEGDGSTVVNVYYTRNYYTITFKAPGKCSITPNHIHTDACYDTICGLGHTHTADCVAELVCPTEEHTAHTAECMICDIPEHIHGSVGCECTEQEHIHTVDCWNNIGSVQNNLSGAPVKPEDGYIYRSSYRYYIYISGVWYRYSGWGVSSGDIVDPACGKKDHVHGTDCSCSQTVHTHTDSCYRDVIHVHTTACYQYSCGALEHSHTDACRRCICGIPENHSHTNNCTNSSRTNTVKTVYAKYRQSLKNIWPVTDDNGKTYNSGERWSPSGTDLYDYVLVYIDEMPGDDFTLTVDTSNNSTYTMNYYQQVLPGESYDVTYGGNNYKQYSQIKANYGKVTKAEDFFNIRGFYQYASDPAFSGDSITINGSNKTVNFYYNRIVDHEITFNNNGAVLTDKTVYGLPYGASVAHCNFVPPYPENLEPNAYTFAGWYTSPGCFDGTEANWETLTMPEGDLLLYAKWEPVTHTVRVFKDKNKTEQLGKDQIVDHGAFADAPSGNITNGNYVFLGWFYEDEVNGEIVEKAFVFNGIPILDDMDIYARWGSHFSVNYTIYYKLLSTGEEIADPTVGSAIVGHNKTFLAKTGNDLYEGYRMGYYPRTNSHTITMSADGNHEFTFYYEFVESMPYKVEYIDKSTGQPIFAEKRVMDNNLSIVTETFVRADKMMPDAYQKRLVLSSDSTDADKDGIYDANVITFYYNFDETHAYYRVVHYIQNITGDTYREFRSEDNVGVLGSNYTVNALTLTGFAYQGGKTTVNGVVIPDAGTSVTTTLTADGALIEFYYDRMEYDYLVRYIDSRTGNDIYPAKAGTGAFGLQIIEHAGNFENIGYTLVSESAKTHTISANAEMNVILFSYQEKNVALKYQIIGPDGCGHLSQESENITAISGVPNGSSPFANNGFIFLGWYTDADCTIAVEEDWVDRESGLLIPQKVGDVWYATTYYAKFAALETDLIITTRATATIDADQVFIFHIQGKPGTETAGVDLIVTVVGNDSVTITKLPTGIYTVTELADWSWRYENATASREINLTYNDGYTEIIFDNSRENGKWLDGNAVKDNLF